MAEQMRPIIATFALATASSAAANHISLPVQSTIANNQYADYGQFRPDNEADQSVKGQVRPSKAAEKAIRALHLAVNAKDVVNLGDRLAAAQSAARTDDDRYILASLRLRASALKDDLSGMERALDELLATGKVDQRDVAPMFNVVAHGYYDEKQFDAATRVARRVIATDASNLDALTILGESHAKQGRDAEAVEFLRTAIEVKTRTGQKAEEGWYRRAVALAFKSRQPNSTELSRKWVEAYPSAGSWRDTIRIYQAMNELDEAALLDSMRLAQASGALDGDNDFYNFISNLLDNGLAGEARNVLEHGFTAGLIDRGNSTFGRLSAVASARSEVDQAMLAADAMLAINAPCAGRAMATAEALYGHGLYREAAELFRAALGKHGVDKDLANLRLGMALARAGDKAGASNALNMAGGTRSELARLWLTLVATGP